MLIGTRLHPYAAYPSLDALVDYAQRAEDAGFDYLAIAHHSMFPAALRETMGATWWDPIVLATHIAARTTNIRLFFTALVLPECNPVQLALQLATLDVVADGRIRVGVGVGWCKEEFEFLGADFAGRGARMEEYVEILRVIWTQESPSFEGTFFKFSNASADPKPVQAPHPPIYVGGGPKSVDRAARIGDGWLPISSPFETFLEMLEELRHALPRYGRAVEGFPVIRQLPVYAQPRSQQLHHDLSGGHPEETFAGDYGRVREHLDFCESRGVTHMTAMFTVDYDAMCEQIVAFRRAVLDRGR